MARVVKDRIKQTSTTTGTGTVSLSASVAGYQNFSVLGDGNTTFYCIEDANGTAFEVGIGTYTSNTLARTTILDSTNSGNAISLTSGTHDVFVTYPAGRAGFNDEGLSPTLTASGTVTAGKPVIQNTNGTVTQVAETSTPDTNPSFNFQEATSNTTSNHPTSTYESTSGAYVIAWKESSNGYGYVMAGTISNGTMTWGTPTAFLSSTIDSVPNICSGDGAVHITYRSGANGVIKWGTISGTTITLAVGGSIFNHGGVYTNPNGYRCAYDIANNYVMVFYSGEDNLNSYVQPKYYNSSAGTYTGNTSALVKSSVQITTATSEIVYDSDTERCVVFYRDTQNSNLGYANVIQGTGTSASPTASVGSASNFTNSDQIVSYGNIGGIYDTQNDKIFIAWNNTDGNNPSWRGAIITVTGGSTNTIASNGWADIWDYAGGGSTGGIAFDSDKNKIMFYYRDDGNSDYLTYKTITSGASSFTVANGAVIKASDNQFQGNSPSFAPSKGVVLPTRDVTNSGKVSSVTTYYNVVTSSNLTSTNFFGIASNSATTTNPVQINVNGSINNAQTGLNVDKDYYVTDAGLIKERTTTTVTPDTNPTVTTPVVETGSSVANERISISYEATSGYYLRSRRDLNTNYPVAESGTYSSSTKEITWSTAVVIKSESLRGNCVYNTTGGGYGHIAFTTRQSSNENPTVKLVTVSGGTLTIKGEEIVEQITSSGNSIQPVGISYDTSQNTIIAVFHRASSNQTIKAYPMVENGYATGYTYSSSNIATINDQSVSGIQTSSGKRHAVRFDPDTNRTIIIYTNENSTYLTYARVVSASGVSLTVGSQQASTLPNRGELANCYDTQNNKLIIVGNADQSGNDVKYIIATVTGGGTNTISFTSPAFLFSDTSTVSENFGLEYDADINQSYFVYYKAGPNTGLLMFSSDGSTITRNSDTTIYSTSYPKEFGNYSMVYVANKGVSASIGYDNTSMVNFNITLGSTSSTVVNGSVFAGTALSATALELKTFPASTIVGKADGAVTAGKPVIVEADGDFAQTKTTTNNISFSKGSQTSIQASITARHVHTSYNTAQNKFVCFYEDEGASSYLYGNVISNDGTTLTAGSKSSAGNNFNTRVLSVIYIGDSKHIIFMRNDSNNYFAAVVATVSGTSISYGTVNTFHSYSNHFRGTAYWDSDKNVAVFVGCYNSSSKNLAAYSFTVSGTTLTKTAGPVDNVQGVVNYVDSAYDSTNKIGVVAYTDGSDDGYVTTLSASSAGALTWNTAGEAQVSGSNNLALSAGNGMTYDSANEKTILFYKNESTNNYGYTVPITLSGNPATTVAIGSASDVTGVAVFSNDISAIATDYGAIAYTYIQSSVYTSIKYKQGDASGSTISISGADNLVSSSTYYNAPTLAFNPTDNVVVGAYRNGSDDDIDAVAFIASGSVSSSNLTAENYIGIAQETVSTGEDVKVTTISGVDANQSSLTPAQIYYVQTDGTLSTTAGSPSVVAGTAIAATQLLVSRS